VAHLRKPGTGDLAGFDSTRNLQILAINQRTNFYLVAGADLNVFTDDDSCAAVVAGKSDAAAIKKDGTLSAWEKSQEIRPLSVVGKSLGSTTLRAQLDGRDWIAPLTIRVLNDKTCRQVGKATAQVTPELRSEIQSLSLRDAVIRVAEDQMHSAISQSRGFGVYDMDASLDWCGGFAYWCWNQACAIQGVENPFGSSNTVLWSPQRAIHWAMQDTTPAQLLRYKGISPMDGKGRQDYREIGWNGYELRRGDVVLLRDGHAAGWKHVCMVHSVDGRAIVTIDGNQGLPSIKLVNRSLDDKLPDGSAKLVFVAVMRA
jgi:hypothetical protein